MRRLILIGALVAAGCGSSPAPTPTPTPTPLVASLQSLHVLTTGLPQPDGTYAVTLSARNIGTGCAGDISGIVDLSIEGGDQVASLPWSVSFVVKPGDSFDFTACCLGSQYAGLNITYVTRYFYQTVTCP